MKNLVRCLIFLSFTIAQASLFAQDRERGADVLQDLDNTAGALHNQGIQFVLQHLQQVPPRAEIRPRVIQLTKEFCANAGFNCSSIDRIQVPGSTEELLATINGSKAFKNDLRLMFRLISNVRKNPSAPGLSLQQFEISLTDLETTVAGSLRKDERTKFLNVVSTARMSAMFWAPVEEGGLNGIRFLNSGNGTPTPSIDWGGVFGADAEGFLEGLELIEFGPGAVLGASVLSSALAALF